MDLWNPNQYEKFKDQRAKPFWDLLRLVQDSKNPRVIDLGCGTGELTRGMHDQLQASETLGIDTSENMLKQAQAHSTPILRNAFSTWFSTAGMHYPGLWSSHEFWK